MENSKNFSFNFQIIYWLFFVLWIAGIMSGWLWISALGAIGVGLGSLYFFRNIAEMMVKSLPKIFTSGMPLNWIKIFYEFTIFLLGLGFTIGGLIMLITNL